MDGWRGTRLGYAGGRTGWLGNYANNDSLRGTRGLGVTDPVRQANRASMNNNQGAAMAAAERTSPQPFRNGESVINAIQATDRTSYLIGVTGLIGGLYFLASYRGKNKLLKTAKNLTAPVGKPAKKAIDGLTGN